MKIIAFIEDEEVIEKILKHLELWEMKARPPPRVKTPSVRVVDQEMKGEEKRR
jgi:hypothetical protein